MPEGTENIDIRESETDGWAKQHIESMAKKANALITDEEVRNDSAR